MLVAQLLSCPQQWAQHPYIPMHTPTVPAKSNVACLCASTSVFEKQAQCGIYTGNERLIHNTRNTQSTKEAQCFGIVLQITEIENLLPEPNKDLRQTFWAMLLRHATVLNIANIVVKNQQNENNGDMLCVSIDIHGLKNVLK